MHVNDVVTANLLSGLQLLEGYKVINVGTGVSVSIYDLAKMISNNIEFGEARLGDSKETKADLTETYEFLKWVPKQQLNKYIENIFRAIYE